MKTLSDEKPGQLIVYYDHEIEGKQKQYSQERKYDVNSKVHPRRNIICRFIYKHFQRIYLSNSGLDTTTEISILYLIIKGFNSSIYSSRYISHLR